MKRGALSGRQGNDGGGRAEVSTGTYWGGRRRQRKGDVLLWCRQFEMSGRSSFGEVRFMPLKWPRLKECQNASLKLLQKGKNVNFPSARVLQDLSIAFESLDISSSL